MTDYNSIIPPPELVQKWVATTESDDCIGALPTNFEQRICTAAAKWGADTELEACISWFADFYCEETWMNRDVIAFREARRPKLPSLKQQALKALECLQQRTTDPNIIEPIRRALVALDD